MKLILTLLVASVMGGQVCPLVPRPQNASPAEGTFLLEKNVTIEYAPSQEATARLLQGELLHWCTVTPVLSVSSGKSKSAAGSMIRLVPRSGNAPEGYSIRMKPGETVLEASEQAGFTNAVMAFLQLVRLSPSEGRCVKMDCWNIKDAPRYSWRGLMLDESRHFFGKRKVKQILDWMALYRMNRFHWHLSDEPGWRIEIKKYPRLALVGGIGNWGDPDAPARYYTQDEIREIVAYALERGIEIIPEIENEFKIIVDPFAKTIDECDAYEIGYIYRYISRKYGISSKTLVKIVPYTVIIKLKINIISHTQKFKYIILIKKNNKI